jgi:hypothetical protein
MGLDLFDETIALTRALREHAVDHAIVGAVALAVHGAPRATADLDLLLRAADLERALTVARERGFTLDALPMRFSDGLELRRVSKIEGDETLTLDLLLVNPNLEDVWASRRAHATAFGEVVAVSREALVQMKLLAGRPQDLADVRRLQDDDR